MATTATPQATQTSTFTDLVKQAAAVWREAAAVGLRPSIGFPGVRSQDNWQEVARRRKLSSAGFVATAIHHAGSAPEKVADLKRILESDSTALPASRTFLGRATYGDIHNIASATMPEPPSSPGNSTVRRWARDLLGLEGELALVGHSVMELIVIACEVAGKQRPGNFGPWGSVTAREAHLDGLKSRLQSLLDRIPKEYGPDDLEDAVESKGSPPVTTFKISKGAVALAPRWDVAERLITWAAKQEDI